ncbi:MAG: YceH family protein [Gemmataceae bacterium]|nr:YceH family protein [Gemmataceae bacterium]
MTPTPAIGPNGPWPSLASNERRVLGVLVEKAKTSADGYPMSLNALTTGCNQKSNRDPIMDLDEDDVEESLRTLRSMGLVCPVQGGRVDKWRHLLYESWHIDKRESAIIAELLLRGPQTEGELRTRASRMESLPDLETLRGYLKAMVERNLVVYLTAEDRRGAVLTHGLHPPDELRHLKAHFASAPATVATAAPPVPREDQGKLAAEIAELRAEVAALRAEVASLKAQLGG